MSQLIPQPLDYYLDYEGTQNLAASWKAFGSLQHYPNRVHSMHSVRSGQAQLEPTLNLTQSTVQNGTSTDDVQPTGWNLPDSYEQSGVFRQLNQPSALTGNLTQATQTVSYSSSQYSAGGAPAKIPFIPPVYHQQPVQTWSATQLGDRTSLPPSVLNPGSALNDSSSNQGVFSQIQSGYNQAASIFNTGKKIYKGARDAYDTYNQYTESSAGTIESAATETTYATDVAEAAESTEIVADVEEGLEIAALLLL